MNLRTQKIILNITLFILFLALGTLLFGKYNQLICRMNSVRDARIHAYTDSVSEILSAAYFHSQQFSQSLMRNDLNGAKQYTTAMARDIPIIKSVKIQENSPNYFGDYTTQRKGNPSEMSLNFKIFDGQNHVMNDFHVQVILDISSFREASNGVEPGMFQKLRRKYNYFWRRKRAKPYFIRPMQLILVILLSYSLTAICNLLWSQNRNFFYSSRGLEKIIYLFEMTDRYSANHSRNVAEISYFLGKKLCFSGKRLNDIKVAAYLHDIGKISIPVEILNKKEALSKDDFGEIKKHVTYSSDIINSFDELSHLSDMILYHHEKMDGTGYPEGLKGDKIPLESRIIAVADIYEALTGERPYRQPMTASQALELMATMSLDQRVFHELVMNEKAIIERLKGAKYFRITLLSSKLIKSIQRKIRKLSIRRIYNS